jgi:hypothetical protein
LSLSVFAQVPLQLVSPAWHDSAHDPPEHTSPAAQAVPQKPQFWLSVCWSTQVPLQFVRPTWQERAHEPLEQI